MPFQGSRKRRAPGGSSPPLPLSTKGGSSGFSPLPGPSKAGASSFSSSPVSKVQPFSAAAFLPFSATAFFRPSSGPASAPGPGPPEGEPAIHARLKTVTMPKPRTEPKRAARITTAEGPLATGAFGLPGTWGGSGGGKVRARRGGGPSTTSGASGAGGGAGRGGGACRTASGGGLGGAAGPGARNCPWHFGQRSTLPAAASGTRQRA